MGSAVVQAGIYMLQDWTEQFYDAGPVDIILVAHGDYRLPTHLISGLVSEKNQELERRQ